MSDIQIKVNNGKRIIVELSDFVGTAGFVEHPSGVIQLAYLPNRRGATEGGSIITVDGESFEVLRVETSQVVEGFRVLTLARVDQPE